MTTLSLDLATRCGYALLRADGKIESGVERFQPRPSERPGARWARFKIFLLGVKQSNPDLGLIAFEDVKAHGPGVQAAHVYGGFIATLQLFCEHHGIEYRGAGVGLIKKAWTGDGWATKKEMVARCRELGFNPKDDNEADALALLHLVTNRVPPLPPERLARKVRTRRPRKAAVQPAHA
jgi:hypothetical protein